MTCLPVVQYAPLWVSTPMCSIYLSLSFSASKLKALIQHSLEPWTWICTIASPREHCQANGSCSTEQRIFQLDSNCLFDTVQSMYVTVPTSMFHRDTVSFWWQWPSEMGWPLLSVFSSSSPSAWQRTSAKFWTGRYSRYCTVHYVRQPDDDCMRLVCIARIKHDHLILILQAHAVLLNASGLQFMAYVGP